MTNQQLIYRMRVDMRLRGMAENTQDCHAPCWRMAQHFCKSKNCSAMPA